MTDPTALRHLRRLPASSLGILTMVLGILLFTLMDALAKHLTLSYPTLQVIWARYAGQTVALLVIFAPRLGKLLRTRHPRMHAARSLCQFGATAFFFLSLSHIGLAEATALMDINPVLITLGAALFLGERLGPRRLAGVAAALIGALIIVRPGSGVFTTAALLPLAAAVCYASFALLTRRLGPVDTVWTSLLHAGLFGTLVTTAALPWTWAPIAAADLWGFLLIGLIGMAGQFCLIRAFSLTEATVLAPFGYVGLIFATFWGALFFGNLPDGWTLAGMLVIAGSGLYVWHREAAARPARARPAGTA